MPKFFINHPVFAWVVAIVIMLAEVGVAALASWLLADEVLGSREVLGGTMIVAASLFSAKMERVRAPD